LISVADALQRREQHDPNVLRVAGFEPGLCLPLHDQVGHQPERPGDGAALLAAVWHPDTPVLLRELPTVDVLRQVLVQNTKVTTDRTGREVVTLRDADTDGLPPGSRGSCPRTTPMPAGAVTRTALVQAQRGIHVPCHPVGVVGECHRGTADDEQVGYDASTEQPVADR
jgi:hypothetical protein